jgi:L-ascorbate metabolism protein UlaG (beta-lactamase superfamily)
LSGVECDILLVPVSGTYVMTAEEAAEAAEIVGPRKYAIPMHYDDIVGTVEDAWRFAEIYSGEVRIIDKIA